MSPRNTRRTRRPSGAGEFFIEQLEPRLLLDGNVDTFFVGNDLFIDGDAADNAILIESTGNPGEIRISSIGALATTIDGLPGPVVIGGVDDDINVAVRGGDDTVRVRGAEVHGRLEINGGEGDDTVELQDGAFISDRVLIDGFDGDDDVTIGQAGPGDPVLLGDRLVVSTHDGQDTITLHPGTDVRDDVGLYGGDGNDAIQVNGTSIKGDLEIDGDAGDNDVGVVDTQVRGDACIMGDDGDDQLGAADSSFGKDFTLMGGAGGDNLFATNVRVFGDVDFHTGEGVDRVDLGASEIDRNTMLYTSSDELVVNVQDSLLNCNVEFDYGYRPILFDAEYNFSDVRIGKSLDVGVATQQGAFSFINTQVDGKTHLWSEGGDNQLTLGGSWFGGKFEARLLDGSVGVQDVLVGGTTFGGRAGFWTSGLAGAYDVSGSVFDHIAGFYNTGSAAMSFSDTTFDRHFMVGMDDALQESQSVAISNVSVGGKTDVWGSGVSTFDVADSAFDGDAGFFGWGEGTFIGSDSTFGNGFTAEMIDSESATQRIEINGFVINGPAHIGYGGAEGAIDLTDVEFSGKASFKGRAEIGTFDVLDSSFHRGLSTDFADGLDPASVHQTVLENVTVDGRADLSAGTVEALVDLVSSVFTGRFDFSRERPRQVLIETQFLSVGSTFMDQVGVDFPEGLHETALVGSTVDANVKLRSDGENAATFVGVTIPDKLDLKFGDGDDQVLIDSSTLGDVKVDFKDGFGMLSAADVGMNDGQVKAKGPLDALIDSVFANGGLKLKTSGPDSLIEFSGDSVFRDDVQIRLGDGLNVVDVLDGEFAGGLRIDVKGALNGDIQPVRVNLRTEVKVKDGSTVVLGGLLHDSVTFKGGRGDDDLDVTPLLGGLPLVNYLFKGGAGDDTIRRDPLLLLVTPKIIQFEQELD